MITRKAIQEYLSKERDNFNWIKTLSVKELDYEISKLPYQLPDLLFPLKQHQKACFIIGVAYPEFEFWLDMGLGKTLLSLLLIDYYHYTKQIRQTLVVVPTNEVAQGWEEQIQQWMPNLPYVLLLESTEEKWNNLKNSSKGLVITTYSGLAWMVSNKQEVLVKKKKVVKLVPDRKLIDKLSVNIDAIVFDETTKVANHESLWYKICNVISQKCKIRYGLAGRAFGRDPIKLWAQFKLVDRGETLTPSIGFFREVFFTKTKNYWGGPGSMEYKFDKKMEDDLTRIISHRSIRYSIDECEDLPELVRITKQVEFPQETKTYYQRIAKEILSAHGNFHEVQNSFIRMRQTSSGFLGFKDDESGEKAQIEFPDNPKFDLLVELINEMPIDKKFLVFYEFTWSGSKIVQTLIEQKIKVGWLWSGTKNWPQIKSRFDGDKEFRGLVIQNKKGNLGLNLQSASYVFFYESPVSPIDREQAEFRAHRQGQKSRVIQYDLIVKDSMDERILKFHKEGNSLFSALIDDPARVIGIVK
jgi:SNF2 family DNA or RNA helicase